MNPKQAPRALVLFTALVLVLTGCGRNMFDQPRFNTYQENPFLPGGVTAQEPIAGTVSRERGTVDPAFYTGVGPAGPLTELPIALDTAVLQRGMERYNIYCAPCHNYNGDGRGVVVRRGFPQPSSFHEQRLRDSPVGYFFNAMTNGFGRMFPYDSRISAEDRWAIAGYVRALQLSQAGSPEDVPEGASLQAPTIAGAE